MIHGTVENLGGKGCWFGLIRFIIARSALLALGSLVCLSVWRCVVSVWCHVFHATSPAVSDEHGLLCLVLRQFGSICCH